MPNISKEFCPCGSGHYADSCCLPIIHGIQQAVTAEQLMRSRYTAYTLEDSEYLLSSWHPHSRPESLNVEGKEMTWTGLTVLNLKAGLKGDIKGEVAFIAQYELAGRPGQVEENSRFVFEQGQWFYLDGEINKIEKIGRNSPCPCGSGKKYKKCCAVK